MSWDMEGKKLRVVCLKISSKNIIEFLNRNFITQSLNFFHMVNEVFLILSEKKPGLEF